MRAVLCGFVRTSWTSFSAAGVSGTCRTLAPVWGRRARPARCPNSCCSRCRRSFYSGAAEQTRQESSWSVQGNDSTDVHQKYGAAAGEESLYLSARNGELLQALLALSRLIVFKPGVTLAGGGDRR